VLDGFNPSVQLMCAISMTETAQMPNAISIAGKLSVAVALVGFFSGHGGPQGETDTTGHPKEGAAENDLGGVISVTLFH
jgi:hypothetical protein